MKALVVFYSRTGTTRTVAEAIASVLGADTEPIEDMRKRTGILGYLRSGREAMCGREVEIREPRADPSRYDLVIVGTPVWGGTVSSPVRSYLVRHKGRLRRAGFFTTSGSGSGERTFAAMASLAGVTPIASLALAAREVARGAHRTKVNAFVEEVKKRVEG